MKPQPGERAEPGVGRRSLRIVVEFVVAGAALALARVAWAQAAPLPPTIEPGRIQERAQPPRAPSPPVELPEIKREAPSPPAAIPGGRIVLHGLHIVGATAIPVARLQARAAPWLERPLTGSEIFDLARALTAFYRDEGYVLSQVVVPVQTMTQGVLTLQVIEGYVAEVRVEGDPSVAASLAALGERIKASRPLTAAVLERYLLLANDLPGVHVRAVLSPSHTPGAADLTLIAGLRRIEGFFTLDNYGSRYLGPGQLSVGVTGSQLLGVDDQWQAVGVTTGDNRELAFGQLGYTQVLNTEGLRLGASASTARTRPGDVLEPYAIRGRAVTAALSLAYPLQRSRNSSLLLRGGYDHRDVDTDTLGTRVTEDRIRALRAGLTWSVLDALDGRNALDVELGKGVGGTGPGDVLKSRVGADSRFAKIAFDYERYQPLGPHYGLSAGLAGQWTDEPLLASEQFALGGRRYGRAYEPAEIVGDRALAFRVEPVYLGWTENSWLKTYRAYAFYDVGKVWNKAATAASAGTSRSLASAGVGGRISLGKEFSVTLELAFPLTRAVASAGENGYDPRLLGSLVSHF